MKDAFTHGWKLLAAAARPASVEPSPPVPYGFTARVLALAREGAPGPSLVSLWQRLALRTLGGMALALAAVTIFELWRGDAPALRPMVEQNVEEQFFWLPS